MVPETSVIFNQLTRLMAGEDFVNVELSVLRSLQLCATNWTVIAYTNLLLQRQ
jgi:hypothetical protein